MSGKIDKISPAATSQGKNELPKVKDTSAPNSVFLSSGTTRPSYPSQKNINETVEKDMSEGILIWKQKSFFGLFKTGEGLYVDKSKYEEITGQKLNYGMVEFRYGLEKGTVKKMNPGLDLKKANQIEIPLGLVQSLMKSYE